MKSKLPPLTPAELETLDYYRDHVAAHSFQPSMEQAAMALDVSKAAIHKRLKNAERKGYIRLHGPRAVEFLTTRRGRRRPR